MRISDWSSDVCSSDLKPRPGSLQRRTPLQAHRLITLIQEVQLPVVAAVQGWAAGLGCQIELAADFAVVTASSQHWVPLPKRGFRPDSGATWLLPRLMRVARAKAQHMTGPPDGGAP